MMKDLSCVYMFVLVVLVCMVISQTIKYDCLGDGKDLSVYDVVLFFVVFSIYAVLPRN